MKQVIEALPRTHDVYSLAFDRWQSAIPIPAEAFSLVIPRQQRLILGLGQGGTLETGITLHQTYGVPYLPATSLKGLAAHYAHDTPGDDFRMAEQNRSGGSHSELLFGSQDAGGLIEFSDGWIDPNCLNPNCLNLKTLVPDVMTPHHGKYYMAAPDDDRTAPTVFDDPVR